MLGAELPSCEIFSETVRRPRRSTKRSVHQSHTANWKRTASNKKLGL